MPDGAKPLLSLVVGKCTYTRRVSEEIEEKNEAMSLNIVRFTVTREAAKQVTAVRFGQWSWVVVVRPACQWSPASETMAELFYLASLAYIRFIVRDVL